jgi:carbon storage regulator
MLVLSRKPGESIVIDDRIVVTVVQIGGGRIRLGIEAPREVHILRSEVYAADRRAEQAARNQQQTQELCLAVH